VARLDAAGVPFKKRPEEGRMRSIAFAFDPDRYWVELVERAAEPPPGAPPPPFFSLAQTMLRVRDPTPSLDFYTKQLGMTLVRKSVADSFTVYFLATLPAGARGLPADPASSEAREYVKSVIYPAGVPVLELTHSARAGRLVRPGLTPARSLQTTARRARMDFRTSPGTRRGGAALATSAFW